MRLPAGRNGRFPRRRQWGERNNSVNMTHKPTLPGLFLFLYRVCTGHKQITSCFTAMNNGEFFESFLFTLSISIPCQKMKTPFKRTNNILNRCLLNYLIAIFKLVKLSTIIQKSFELFYCIFLKLLNV